jgi:hypothetical protein
MFVLPSAQYPYQIERHAPYEEFRTVTSVRPRKQGKRSSNPGLEKRYSVPHSLHPACMVHQTSHAMGTISPSPKKGVSKIFRTDAIKFWNLITKLVWKLPTSTQLLATVAHWLTRHGSSTIYRCFALPQLLYRWRHQSGIFWIHLRR